MGAVHDDGELWQAYDEQGEPITSKGITKPQAAAGALHAASHVWIWRGQGNDTEVLLQKRGASKRTWPGYLDISAAGHIDFGEMPLQAALRETKEELGHEVDPAQLQLLFVHPQYIRTEPEGIIENEFQWVYGLRLQDAATFALQENEVDSLVWMSLSDFRRLAAHKLAGKRAVPHGDAYFAMLLRKIAKREGTL